MKKIVTLAIMMVSLALLNSACSKTFEGIKHDSKKAWKSTKGAIHKATKED